MTRLQLTTNKGYYPIQFRRKYKQPTASSVILLMPMRYKIFIFVLFFFPLPEAEYLFAQTHGTPPPVIRNLVFEGAGIRGLAYAGAVSALEEHHLLDSVQNVGGTSAGAITALMISLGYKSDEIYKIITGTKYKRFNKGCCFFIGGMIRLNSHFGWYRNQRFIKWLEQLVIDKTGTADVRFKDLDSLGLKNLVVTGTCLNHQRSVIFSKESFPDMRIVDAVAISMTIPLYFRAIFMDDKGNTYRNIRDKDSLHVMVDGGVLANYPIYLFDKPSGKSVSGRTADPHTLGFRIDSRAQILQDSIAINTLAPRKIEKLSDYVGALYNVTGETLNRYPLTKDDWRRTVSISSEGIGPRIKKLSFEERMALFNSGKKATEKYLNRLSRTRRK